MRFFSALKLVGLALATAGLLGMAGATTTSAASSQFGPLIAFWDGSSWTAQASPNPEGSAGLNAVVAVSATDVWALGAYGRLGLPYGGDKALAVHWDGSSWQQVAIPTPKKANDLHLYATAATSTNDVWAVGSWAGGRHDKWGGGYSTLIEHWNGLSWTILPSPPRRGTAQLYGVAALSPSNAWAVGYYGAHVGLNRTFVLHWNGKTWRQVASPHPGPYSQLSGIAAVSAHSFWAVGNYGRFQSGHPSKQPLTMRWNGKDWKQVRGPAFRNSSWVSAVAVVGRNSVWAVGSRGRNQPLAEHWNGHAWQAVPVRLGAESLTSLAVVAGNDIWAAGTYAIGHDRTLTMHWGGNAWSLVPSPNPVLDEANHFWAVATASPTAVWAVGCFYLGD